MSPACTLQPVSYQTKCYCQSKQTHLQFRPTSAPTRVPRLAKCNRSAKTRDQHPSLISQATRHISIQTNHFASKFASVAAVTLLGAAWLLGRPERAAAGVLPRTSNRPQVETVVAVPPPASVTASVTSPNDSMLLIVVVCLGFWTLSATISAVIGAVMHLSGRSMSHGMRAAGSWTSAGILDTFDIMRLPLAYEIEEPAVSGTAVRQPEVIYKPWDGPESSYIPVSMVKVLEPGLREAGLVVRKTLLQPSDDLSIISITESGNKLNDNGGLMTSNGGGSNGKNGHGNGITNGSKNS